MRIESNIPSASLRCAATNCTVLCKSAGYLTPYRRPTLTPPIALEPIGTAMEIGSCLGSRLDADRGQSLEPMPNPVLKSNARRLRALTRGGPLIRLIKRDRLRDI